ncbi:hypothetical protein FB566_3046 [Stackebrandtia endophytica]|uniref:Uncharacterized protein n=1 Tax=Stackebrandtia endophytica TaxID=1496996 RepID=A0A543AY34_9ACTN|nr:hypothetical protein [Stackebrandtia endophytica]TQL77487.1 hypothetical protein FB566_3046 [Stackebrandtia endophytica]
MTPPKTRPARQAVEAADRAWRFAKRRKLLVIVVAWGVLVGILAFVSPSVTVREQTTVADSLEQLDQAMGDAAGVLVGSDYGYYVTPLISADGCSITPLRSGERYFRELTVYAADFDAAAAQLANSLADRYRLERVSPEGVPARYTGIIPGYVELALTVRADNTIVWRADTGCRQPGDAVGSIRPSFEPPMEMLGVLEALGMESTGFELGMAQCGDLGERHGTVRSVSVSEPADGITEVTAVADSIPERAQVLVSTENVLVYRLGDTVTSAAVTEDDVTVATTVDCQ